MKQYTSSARVTTPNRRAFLKGLGALGAASVCCSRPALANSESYGSRVQLFAQGAVTDFSLVWPTPQLPPLPEGSVLSLKIQFPVQRRDILEWHTLLDVPGLETQIVTLFHARIDQIGLSDTPAPNFGLFGKVIDNPIISPFGDLTGRVSIIYGQFDAPGDHTTFTLLGGAAVGSHASAVRTATGSLYIRGHW